MSSEQPKPKIAFKATLKGPITFKKQTPPAGTPSLTTKLSIFQTDDDESHEKDGKRSQLVTGFDQSSGAILHKSEKSKETKQEYIIPSVPNRDWKVQIPDPEKQAALSECKDKDEKNLTFGLNVVAKEKSIDANGAVEDSHVNADHKPASVDEEDEEDLIEPISEQEAYKRDVYMRPDAPDLDAYDRMPVEEFGAALLRGMGWKTSVPDNTPRERSADNETTEKLFKRPALLGLGAKEIKDDSKSGKHLKPHTSKKEREYVPLLKVSKATGKVITDSDQDSGDQSGSDSHGSTKNFDKSSEEIQLRISKSSRHGFNSKNYHDRHSSSSSKQYFDVKERSDRYSSRYSRTDRDYQDRYSSKGRSLHENYERSRDEHNSSRGSSSSRRHTHDSSERKRRSEYDDYQRDHRKHHKRR